MESKKTPLRSFIAAPKGKVLVMCDLSQAETWVVAYLAKEETMKWALMNSDIHYETAAAIFDKPLPDIVDNLDQIFSTGQSYQKENRIKQFTNIISKDERYTGKRVNHASSYRMSPNRFTQVFNAEAEIPITLAQAKRFNERWHEKYSGIRLWWNELERELRSNNRTIKTPYGRGRTFYGPWGDELLKEGTAYIPQSTVGDHFNGYVQYNGANIKGGLIRIKEELIDKYDDNKLINQSHDSFMAEIPTSIVSEFMESAITYLSRPIIINGEECNIPVDGEVGERWGEMTKWRKAA